MARIFGTLPTLTLPGRSLRSILALDDVLDAEDRPSPLYRLLSTLHGDALDADTLDLDMLDLLDTWDDGDVPTFHGLECENPFA